MIRPRSALLLTACFAAAATTAACHPRPIASFHPGSGGVHVQTEEPMDGAVTVADRLDCPSEIGTLTRTGQSPDGAACDYRSEKGVIHLGYADGSTDPKAALAPLKRQLDAELPGVAEKATIQVVSEKDAFGHKTDKVDMPFIHVEDNGDGHSHVRLLGINIDSNDGPGRHHRHDDAGKDDDDTDVSTGNTVANATPPEKRGVELVYVLVSGKPSTQGFHVAGYIAKGPPKGRLVVATFHYKANDSFNHNDRHDDDIDQLMALNVKPA